MSNLAALAHASQAEAPKFNDVFYAAVATLIPVLFVAAALQEDTYAKLIEATRAAHRRYEARGGLRKKFNAGTIFLAAAFVTMLILVFGVIGEILVLVDL